MIRSDVVLTAERVDQLIPLLKAGNEEAAEELIMGYVRYVRTILPGASDDHYSVAIAAMVEAVRKNQGVDKEHKNFTGYIKATVLGIVSNYRASDFLVPIPKGAYKGQQFQMPPKPQGRRASMEHHQRKEQYIQLKECLAQLTNVEREILIMRSESWTLEEIATAVQLGKSSVQRIEQRALGQMRNMMMGGK